MEPFLKGVDLLLCERLHHVFFVGIIEQVPLPVIYGLLAIPPVVVSIHAFPRLVDGNFLHHRAVDKSVAVNGLHQQRQRLPRGDLQLLLQREAAVVPCQGA